MQEESQKPQFAQFVFCNTGIIDSCVMEKIRL